VSEEMPVALVSKEMPPIRKSTKTKTRIRRMASIVSFHPQKGLNPAGGKQTRANNIQKTRKWCG